MSHSYFFIKGKHLIIIVKVQGGEIKIIQSKTISNLHIFPRVILLFKLYSLAIFTFLVMITSHYFLILPPH